MLVSVNMSEPRRKTASQPHTCSDNGVEVEGILLDEVLGIGDLSGLPFTLCVTQTSVVFNEQACTRGRQ